MQAAGGRLTGVPPAAAEAAREGVANAVEAADRVGPGGQALIDAAQQSFVDGWQQAMWVGVAVMAALCVYIFAHGPQTTTPEEAHTVEDARAPV